MKRFSSLLILQAVLSLIAGFLISKMSWLGRVGIKWFMPEYSIFRSWWQTAIALFSTQVIVAGLLWLVKRKATPRIAAIVSLIFLLIGIAGLYLTYNDFQTTFTHKLMKEKFHLGFYLFWLGWIGTSIYFLSLRNRNPRASVLPVQH